MFVCFDCGNGFGRHEDFLRHSCDADVSSFENNFNINDKEVTLAEKESYQEGEVTKDNNQKEGGYIKCPLKCRKLFQKDQFLIPIALKEHVIKSHKSEENSELFQKIVSQAPSLTLNCEVCGKLFTDYSSLTTHFNQTHSEKVEMVPCQMCDNVKCQSDHWECNKCGKRFNTHRARKSHMERFHSQKRNRHRREKRQLTPENLILRRSGLDLTRIIESTIKEAPIEINDIEDEISEVSQVSDDTMEDGEIVSWESSENPTQSYHNEQWWQVIPDQS